MDLRRYMQKLHDLCENGQDKMKSLRKRHEMSDDFIDWLYRQVQYQVCKRYGDCIGCPFRNPQKSSKACNGLTADQKREILMKIYESELKTND